jgi:hypothetical protein
MSGANTGSAGGQNNPKPAKQIYAAGANTGSAGEQKNSQPVKPVKN